MEDLQEYKEKKKVQKLIEDLKEDFDEAFSDDTAAMEYEDFAIIKSDSGIISVVAFNFENRYEFMSTASAAEFLVMNAEHFVDLTDLEDEE